MPGRVRLTAVAAVVAAVVCAAFVRTGGLPDDGAPSVAKKRESAEGVPHQRPADPGRRRTPYDRAVIADHPTAYWPLDETSGPVSDLTGHAPASSEVTGRLGVPGVSGTAAVVDRSQVIRFPSTAKLRVTGSFSLEMWLKPTGRGVGDIDAMSLGRADGSGGIAVSVSSGPNHRVRLAYNGADAATFRGLSPDRFRHLLFTYDGSDSRWRWYVDGTPDASGQLPPAKASSAPSGGLQLGGATSSGPGAGSQSQSLSIDSLAIYPAALSSRRVAAHYRAATGARVTSRHVGGVAVGGLQPWNPRRAADYELMRQANMTWLRSDLGWQYLEPTPGVWDWQPFDEVVADATAAGLNYLAILHTVPAWANGDRGEYAPPADPGLLENYCYQTTRHFVPLGVTDYQIGNEVNLPHPGWPAPDGATYVRSYLVPCVTGVRRAANEVRTSVNVMLGSLTPPDWTGGTDPLSFLSEVYRSGGQGYFTCASWHPYTGAEAPAASRHMTADPRRLHDIMASYGDGAMSIWATEFGYPTAGPRSVSERRQASYADAALDIWYRNSFAGPLLWYSGRDAGASGDDRENHFGLLRYDGSKKRAYATVAAHFTR